MINCENKHSDEVVTQTTSSGDQGSSLQVTYESVHQALGQPWLLESILDYAMRDENGKLCPGNIRSSRLVGKSWKEAVSKKFRDNNEPIYRLKLNETNSLVESRFVKENGKTLDQFVNYWTVGKGAKQPMPTFRVQLEKDYFRQQNYDSFLNCLRKCGAGLVEIELNVPENCGSLTGILSNVVLPVLQKLTVKFTGDSLENVEENEVHIGHASNVTYLLQSLLNRNETLRELNLTSDTWNLYSLPGVQYIYLPESLTSIQISFKASERLVELLSRNQLPNLQYLSLSAENTSLDGLLFRTFENICKTLCSLQFLGETYSGPPRRVSNLLRFPVMEKLKALEIYRIYFELEAEIPNMNLLFPKLEDIILYDQTPGMLQKWIIGDAVTTVTALTLELVDVSKPEIPCNTLPLTLETMQSVHSRFPNVHILRLRISGTESSGLNYVFMEMGQLTNFHIDVVRSESMASSDYWDSLLIGAPLEFVVGMSACQEFWNQVNLENGPRPSLKMLTELNTFSLEEVVLIEEEDDNSGNPLISNLVFVYGFLKMPKLIHLNFTGRFVASEEMESKWKKAGRVIKHSEPK